MRVCGSALLWHNAVPENYNDYGLCNLIYHHYMSKVVQCSIGVTKSLTYKQNTHPQQSLKHLDISIIAHCVLFSEAWRAWRSLCFSKWCEWQPIISFPRILPTWCAHGRRQECDCSIWKLEQIKHVLRGGTVMHKRMPTQCPCGKVRQQLVKPVLTVLLCQYYECRRLIKRPSMIYSLCHESMDV